MDRRDFLKGLGVGSVVPIVGGIALPALAAPSKLGDYGVGIYTDPSVAGQTSTFTVNRFQVTCGVGMPAPAGGPAAPFAMLMYSTRVDSYRVNRAVGEIRAIGAMRSITLMGGQIEEDVEHDFLAIAVDNGDDPPDRFDVHFVTDFWDRSNPMCTPSSEGVALCRFGGALVITEGTQVGDIVVRR